MKFNKCFQHNFINVHTDCLSQRDWCHNCGMLRIRHFKSSHPEDLTEPRLKDNYKYIVPNDKRKTEPSID
jgi:hypothetical protein